MRILFNISSFLVCMLAFTACSGLTPSPSVVAGDESVSLVAITPEDSREAIERRHGGVVVWRPDSGFAVVAGAAGLHGDLTVLNEHREANRGAIGAPGFLAAHDVAGQAWKVWSGAWKVWSGAWKVWSGGEEGSLFPNENHAAWKQIGLFDAQLMAPALGGGVKVAVIDTGIDLSHPAFVGALAPEGEWRDFIDDDRFPQEVAAQGEVSAYGHGTSVAAVIRQVAPGATILPLRALAPDGSGEVTAVAAAIDHAIRKGADIINLSLGSRTHSPVLTRMVELAAEHGVMVVSAAGNSGDQKVLYPAARSVLPHRSALLAIGAGSVDVDDVKADHSAYGERLELLAPGVAIHSAAPDDRLAEWSGTSIAAAVVSGALALGLGEGHNDTVSLAEALTGSAAAIDQANPEYVGKLGWGRVDVHAFLLALGE